jgi:hypothetical protein
MKKMYHLAHLLWLVPGLSAPAALAQAQAPAPRTTITGKVMSADGKEELPGVTVLLKGTTNGCKARPRALMK